MDTLDYKVLKIRILCHAKCLMFDVGVAAVLCRNPSLHVAAFQLVRESQDS